MTGGDPEQLQAADLGGSYLLDGVVMSPDGNAIVGLQQEADGRSFTLQSSSPPGDPWRRLPTPAFEGPMNQVHLRFRPDGRQLLMVAGSRMWTVAWPAAEGNAPRRIFTTEAVDGADWMADSRHLLMHLAGNAQRQGGGLVIGDSQSGRLYPLEWRDGQALQPSAGPDGRFILPYSEADNDIQEIPLDGSLPRPLIATKGNEGFPDWSLSGDQMVYITARNGPAEIWIWSPGNDLYRPLVTVRSFPRGNISGSPAFSPDARESPSKTNRASG